MKFLSFVLMLSMVGCATEQSRVNKMIHSTVMVTNLPGNSGGSGTILSSHKDGSLILTNAHVCEVVRKGGYVQSSQGKSFVVAFAQSEAHDLCLIKINDDLNTTASIATSQGDVNKEVYVSGHPHLMPTMVTKGFATSPMVVQVMTKLRSCTPEETSNSDTALFCLFAGGIPIVKTYTTTPVSALIQPGSSGSAVYNADGQVVAVIFAGSGDLGYGLAVPLDYVRYFVFREDKKFQSPELEGPITAGRDGHRDWSKKIEAACSKAETEGQKKLCSQFEEALKNIWMVR